MSTERPLLMSATGVSGLYKAATLNGRALTLIVLLLLLSLCHSVGVSAEDGTCHSSGKRPFTPYGLDLCYMYSHKACCLSGYDQQYIRSAYMGILPQGAGCKGGSQRTYASLYALREFLCLPCNPEEPTYRFRSVDGDIADGGVVPPSANSDPNEYTWRVCRSFLYGPQGSVEGLWGDDGSRYDECGVVLQTCPATPIFDTETSNFIFPSSTCAAGTELVVPSVVFKDASDPGVEMLLRVAQTMPDFQMVIVNDSDPAFDFKKTPCFGRREGSSSSSRPLGAALLTLGLVFASVVLT